MIPEPVVYIAGPVTDVPKYWEPFEAAEDQLKTAGFVPINPATLPAGLNIKHIMQLCTVNVLTADAVLMLKGWEHSEGAKLEKALAEYTGVPVFEDIRELLANVPRPI